MRPWVDFGSGLKKVYVRRPAGEPKASRERRDNQEESYQGTYQGAIKKNLKKIDMGHHDAFCTFRSTQRLRPVSVTHPSSRNGGVSRSEGGSRNANDQNNAPQNVETGIKKTCEEQRASAASAVYPITSAQCVLPPRRTRPAVAALPFPPAPSHQAAIHSTPLASRFMQPTRFF